MAWHDSNLVHVFRAANGPTIVDPFSTVRPCFFSCFKALYFKCPPGLHIAKMNRLPTTGVFIYRSGGTHINLGNSWCLQMSVQIIFCLTSILFPKSEIKENNNEECILEDLGMINP